MQFHFCDLQWREVEWKQKQRTSSASNQSTLVTVKDKKCRTMHLHCHWYVSFYDSEIFSAPDFSAFTWSLVPVFSRKYLTHVWYLCGYYCPLWIQIEKGKIYLSWINKKSKRSLLHWEVKEQNMFKITGVVSILSVPSMVRSNQVAHISENEKDYSL